MPESAFVESERDKFMRAQAVAEEYMTKARLNKDETRDYKSKWESAKAVLAERERELLELKGPCSGAAGQSCRLHYAHNGPCDTNG